MTISGLWPPSSSCERLPRRPAVSRMPSPTGTEPVNEIARTPGCSTSGVPTAEPRPMTTFRTPARQPGVIQRPHDVQAGERRVLRELEHHGVAVDQRRRELPHRDRGREVPRGDQADDADRAVHGVDRPAGDRLLVELADRAERLAGRVAQDLRRPAASMRASRSGLPISRVMSCAIASARWSISAARPRSARRHGARSARAPTRAARPRRAWTARSTSSRVELGNSPTTSSGRAGLRFS